VVNRVGHIGQENGMVLCEETEAGSMSINPERPLRGEAIHCWGQLFGVLLDPWQD
jgi:hypothetical protein